MSKLTQLQDLAERFPVYFNHAYYKELERAQARDIGSYDGNTQEQPEVEGEWTDQEKEWEAKRIQGYGKGTGVSKN